MMKTRILLTPLVLVVGSVLGCAVVPSSPSSLPSASRELTSDKPIAVAWIPLAEGVEVATLSYDLRSGWPGLGLRAEITYLESKIAGPGELTIVRVDPNLAGIELLVSTQMGFDGALSLVAETYGLTVATNANEFATDEMTSVGYLRNCSEENARPHSHILHSASRRRVSWELLSRRA